jgi:hypothetical protein
MKMVLPIIAGVVALGVGMLVLQPIVLLLATVVALLIVLVVLQADRP